MSIKILAQVMAFTKSRIIPDHQGKSLTDVTSVSATFFSGIGASDSIDQIDHRNVNSSHYSSNITFGHISNIFFQGCITTIMQSYLIWIPLKNFRIECANKSKQHLIPPWRNTYSESATYTFF